MQFSRVPHVIVPLVSPPWCPPRRGGCAPTRTWRSTAGAGSSAWFPWLARETSTSPSSANQRGGSPQARTRGVSQTSRVGRFPSLGSDGLFHLKHITCRCHFLHITCFCPFLRVHGVIMDPLQRLQTYRVGPTRVIETTLPWEITEGEEKLFRKWQSLDDMTLT